MHERGESVYSGAADRYTQAFIAQVIEDTLQTHGRQHAIQHHGASEGEV